MKGKVLPISKPFFNLNDWDLHKMAGAKDTYLDDRTLRKRLTIAGVEIRKFGDQDVVFWEDLVSSAKPIGSRYKSKGKISI